MAANDDSFMHYNFKKGDTTRKGEERPELLRETNKRLKIDPSID
jgi:hypothetical protein